MRKIDNSCEGKIIYDSLEKANEAAAHLNKTSKSRMNSYKCPLCKSHFHIGHSFKAKQQDNKPKKINWEHHPGIHWVDPYQIKNYD